MPFSGPAHIHEQTEEQQCFSAAPNNLNQQKYCIIVTVDITVALSHHFATKNQVADILILVRCCMCRIVSAYTILSVHMPSCQ